MEFSLFQLFTTHYLWKKGGFSGVWPSNPLCLCVSTISQEFFHSGVDAAMELLCVESIVGIA